MLNLLLQAAPTVPVMPDWTAVVVDLLAVLGGGAVVSFVVYGVRLVLPKIPRFVLPLISMGLGFLGTWVASLLTGTDLSPIVAAAIGAAAVWIREIKSTVEEHGASS